MLTQDGLISGAVYGLIGFSLVLVFSVTRVIYLPKGEYVAFSALTFAALLNGGVPGLLGVLKAIELFRGCVVQSGTAQERLRRLVRLALPILLVALFVLSGLSSVGGAWTQEGSADVLSRDEAVLKSYLGLAASGAGH